MDLNDKRYIMALQCDRSRRRCGGYHCELALHKRRGAFRFYRDRDIRMTTITCGGCDSDALAGKIKHLLGKLRKVEQIVPGQVVVHLASCMTRHSHHGPRCCRVETFHEVCREIGIDCVEDTYVFGPTEKKRQAGLYPTNPRGLGPESKGPTGEG
ncbi:MAG: CGGC domain-containing protein [Phycisphaerae bacterium]